MQETRGVEASATEAAAAGGDGRKLRGRRGDAHASSKPAACCAAVKPRSSTRTWVGLALPGCQVGVTDHAGYHQLLLLTVRPTRVEPLPGVRQIGCEDHTGRHRLVLLLQNTVSEKCPYPWACWRRSRARASWRRGGAAQIASS
jgi:hypothetical protein